MRVRSKQASPSTTSPAAHFFSTLWFVFVLCFFCPSTARASSVPTRTKDNRRGRGSATQVFQRCGVSESKSSPSVKSSCFRQLSPSQDLTNHGKTHSVNMKKATLRITRETTNKDGKWRRSVLRKHRYTYVSICINLNYTCILSSSLSLCISFIW